MENLSFQKETSKEISPLNNTKLHIIEGEYGEKLIFPPDYKPEFKQLSDEAISFILMKEKEIAECEEEVKLAESNLKTAKKKLYSSKHCLESFSVSVTNNTK